MRTHITTMGTNHVFQNVFLSQLSMEFVTKENDETTIGFIHLQWNSEDTSIVRTKIFVNKKKMSPHLRYSSKFALTHTYTCMSIVTLHLLNFLSFLTSPIVYYLCKLFLGLCYFSYYACILAVPLQVYKSYCSFIILFSHEFH